MVTALVLLGLVAYAVQLTCSAPEEERATAFATIATGMALVVVAFLTYLLERRSYEVNHVPSLGIIWKEPRMYPCTEIIAGEEREVYAEFVMWNAGNIPVLVWQPARAVFDPRLRCTGFGMGRVEVERIQQGRTAAEKSFPIVLGVGETCVWRQFTGDMDRGRPLMAVTIEEDRERAVRFLQTTDTNRRFLYEVLYSARPPSAMTRQHFRRQFVGFSYKCED